MPPGFLLPLLGLLFVSFWVWLDYKQKIAGKAAPPELEAALEDFQARLEAAEAERARLTERVQNLEAIATAEPLPAAEGPRLDLPGDEFTPAEEAERLARRLRERG